MMDGDNAWLTASHLRTVGLVASSARRAGGTAAVRPMKVIGIQADAIRFGIGVVNPTAKQSQPALGSDH